MTQGLFAERLLACAVGRYCIDGPLGYRASTMPDAPLRATRDEAEADEREWLAA